MKNISGLKNYFIFLLNYASKSKILSLLVILLSSIEVSYYLIFPSLLNPLIDSIKSHSGYSRSLTILSILLVAYIVHIISSLINTVCKSNLVISCINQLKEDLLSSFFIKKASFNRDGVLSHFTSEISDIEATLASILPGILCSGIQLIFGILLLFLINFYLTVIIILLLLLTNIIIKPFERKSKEKGLKKKILEAKYLMFFN